MDILFGDDVAYYHMGRRVPTVALYVNPTLHHVHYVAPYVAKRLLESEISHFSHPDVRASRVIELACGGRCRHGPGGVSIED
ncbi:MAG: hypothetical protein ACK4M3_00515, partial [Pyrobaculum sp.]